MWMTFSFLLLFTFLFFFFLFVVIFPRFVQVVEHSIAQKRIAFWYRRRKAYSRTTGNKQPHTVLRVLDVLYAGPRNEAEAKAQSSTSTVTSNNAPSSNGKQNSSFVEEFEKLKGKEDWNASLQ